MNQGQIDQISFHTGGQFSTYAFPFSLQSVKKFVIFPIKKTWSKASIIDWIL